MHPFNLSPVTLPLQPCNNGHHTGKNPEGSPIPINILTRVTLKTTVSIPTPETVAAWPSPSPSPTVKVTTAPGPTQSIEISTQTHLQLAAPTATPAAILGGEPSNPNATTDLSDTVSQLANSPWNAHISLGLTSSRIEFFIPATPTEVTISGIIISVSDSIIDIGGQKVGDLSNAAATVAVSGQLFTVNPTQVVGPHTTIQLPQATPFIQTTIAGVSVTIESSVAIIGGSTFSVGPGSDPKTVHVGGQMISVGSDGLGFLHTTLAPQLVPIHPITVGGLVVTALGSTKAVVDGTSFTFSAGSVPQTQVINGQTLTLGQSRIVLASINIGGPSNRGATQTASHGGLPVTQIGSNLVVVAGTTFNIGPGAPPVTTTIDGQNISIGPDGISVGSTTIHPPYALPTSVVTVEGVTIIESGSLARIDGTIFNIGAKARPTTAIINDQNVVIGSEGITVGKITFPIPTNPAVTTQFIAGGITFSEIGSNLAIIGSNTFTVGSLATITTTTQNGQMIIVGPGGVLIGSTTIEAPFSPPPTTIMTAGGITFSEIGSTLAVIGGKTFTVGPGVAATTQVSDGKTVIIGTNGLVLGSTTILAPFVSVDTRTFTIGPLTVSELGFTLVVIDGSTFTIGPYAPQTTKFFSGQMVGFGPHGVVFASTTIPYVPTQTVTVGGLAVTEIGSTVVVIKGSTFTIGPGAPQTSQVFDGQTISIGPAGLGFKTTTINFVPTSEESVVSTWTSIVELPSVLPSSNSKKNVASSLKGSRFGEVAALMAAVYVLERIWC